MATALDAHQLWKALDPPSADDPLTFSAIAVPGRKTVRLGRSSVGPALLFELPEPGPPSSPIELKNLSARFNLNCRVEHDGQVVEGLFTVVMCTSTEPALHRVFLDALQPVLNSAEQGSTAIHAYVESFVELFRSLGRTPLTSVLGLWGELFLMWQAAEPDALLTSWHILPNDRYDFAYGNERLEVKTTVGRRHHTFSLDQLRPPPSTHLWVASIVTESSAAGASVLDLVNAISESSSSPDGSSRIIKAVAQALGSETPEWSSVRYDSTRAQQSLRLLPHHLVPTMPEPPARVWDVRFKADLEEVEDDGSSIHGALRSAARPSP